MQLIRSRVTRAVALLLSLAGMSQGAGGQAATGAVTGRVTDVGTKGPLSDVRLQVVGSLLAGRSDANGTYRITGVPAGTYTVRAIRLGYSQGVASVTVTAGGTATANFALSVAATNLDAITISATGEQQRKREIGASISRIDSGAFNPATVANFSQVLAARTPGIVVQQGAGTSGVGSRIRLRGVT
jgi:iron complex outermembrane receptor protein